MSMVVARYRNAPDVGLQPIVTLVRWSLFSLPGGSRHFCGVHAGTPPDKGRVSSEIVGFDPPTMTGMTRSGRLYRLEGPQSENDDTALIRDAWLAANGMDAAAFTVVGLPDMAHSAN